jgi:hypothetical protein
MVSGLGAGGESDGAPILWMESGLGLKWALVRLQKTSLVLPAGLGADVLFYELDKWASGADGWSTLAAPVAGPKVLTHAGGVAGALTWEDPGGGGALPAGVKGNVLYHNGVDWIVLAPPGAFRYLRIDAADNVAWDQNRWG